MAMTVVVPGSAQIAAGHRRLGKIALRCAAAGLAFVVALVIVGVVAPQQLVAAFTDTWFLVALRLGLVIYAVGWAFLLVDAWRIADPLGLAQGQRLFVTGLNGLLCFGLSGGLLFTSHLVAVQHDFIETVFGSQPVSEAERGRYNNLLLGGEAGPGRSGVRPDSLSVASIDEETGRTVLLGLPRNLADVPFPDGTVMSTRFPNGFDCDGCYLNGVNTWAEDHADLFPGVENPGIEATTQAVEEITGLAINYYALIDLRGFRDLVDATGGVDIAARERIPIGGVGGPVTGCIEPGRQHLDGYETLWYARSRATSDDYSRMARQKCVMNAMLEQLSPRVVVTKFEQIAKASEEVISTNLPASELDRFMQLAVKAKSRPIETVSFFPPLVNTAEPDVGVIQNRVQLAVDKAASRDEDNGEARPHRRRQSVFASGTGGGPATTGGSIGSMAEGYAANDATDLGSAC
jgi:LCP family protein required for cell wall assembly